MIITFKPEEWDYIISVVPLEIKHNCPPEIEKSIRETCERMKNTEPPYMNEHENMEYPELSLDGLEDEEG